MEIISEEARGLVFLFLDWVSGLAFSAAWACCRSKKALQALQGWLRLAKAGPIPLTYGQCVWRLYNTVMREWAERPTGRWVDLAWPHGIRYSLEDAYSWGVWVDGVSLEPAPSARGERPHLVRFHLFFPDPFFNNAKEIVRTYSQDAQYYLAHESFVFNEQAEMTLTTKTAKVFMLGFHVTFQLKCREVFEWSESV